MDNGGYLHQPKPPYWTWSPWNPFWPSWPPQLELLLLAVNQFDQQPALINLEHECVHDLVQKGAIQLICWLWVHGYHNTTAITGPPGRRREQTGFEDGGRAVHCGQFDPRGAAKQTPVLSFDAHKLLLCKKSAEMFFASTQANLVGELIIVNRGLQVEQLRCLRLCCHSLFPWEHFTPWQHAPVTATLLSFSTLLNVNFQFTSALPQYSSGWGLADW